jgi:hypothetical protein
VGFFWSSALSEEDIQGADVRKMTYERLGILIARFKSKVFHDFDGDLNPESEKVQQKHSIIVMVALPSHYAVKCTKDQSRNCC